MKYLDTASIAITAVLTWVIFASCATTDTASIRAIADPIVQAAAAGYAQKYGVPPAITAGVTGAIQNQLWGMLAQAQAGNSIAQGSSIPAIGNAVAAQVSQSNTPVVTQLTTALTSLKAIK